jgi:hypothetical protein
MTNSGKAPDDLILEALCLRYRASSNVGLTMTRQELQDATGLRAEALIAGLQALVGPTGDQAAIRFVDHEQDKITLGPAGIRRCEDLGTRG